MQMLSIISHSGRQTLFWQTLFQQALFWCGLGREVSVSRRSWDVLMSCLGLVLDKILNVLVSDRCISGLVLVSEQYVSVSA